MDLRFQKYGFWDFTGPMASVTWWREVCHFIGGIILTLTLAGTFKVISIGVSELTPKLRALQIGEASFLATFAVSNLFCYLEFLRENEGKARDLKNVVDWLAWTLGSAAVTLIIMATLGPSHLL